MKPFALIGLPVVFRGEAVLPLEVQLPSLRIAIHESIKKGNNPELRLAELETLDKNRFATQQKLGALLAENAQYIQPTVSASFISEGQFHSRYSTTKIIGKKKGNNWKKKFGKTFSS